MELNELKLYLSPEQKEIIKQEIIKELEDKIGYKKRKLTNEMYDYCMNVLTKKEEPTEAELQLLPVVLNKIF